jgi:diguanylate cyclase (GGDEF)-like protein
MLQSLNAIGVLERRSGALYEALDRHQQALNLARTLGMDEEEGDTLSRLGRIYQELEDTPRARRSYEQALARIGAGPRWEQIELELDLAYLDTRERAFDTALGRIERAEAIARALGRAYPPPETFGRRAQILSARGDHAAALVAVDRAIALGNNQDGVRSKILRRLSRANVLLALQRGDEAVRQSSEILEWARPIGDTLLVRDVLKVHAAAQAAVGNSAAAYTALREYRDLSEGLKESVASRRIADLEARLERGVYEADLKRVANERDLAQLRSVQQRWYAFGLLALAVALIVSVLALRARVRAAASRNALLDEQALNLTRAAETDALTGLSNRRGAEREWRERTQRERALLLLDIDHFKRINDGHGHAVGDAVLMEIAARLRLVAPRGAILARWGGEEFLMLIDAEYSAAAALAEEVRATIAERAFVHEGVHVAVTASVGVATDERSPERLLKRADDALYRAKALGRNRVEFAT